jgi:hypothetical protein
MKEIFDSYLTIFMHPFKIYDYFAEGIPLQGRELSPIKRLSLTETLSVSWLITIIRSLLDLLILNFALSAVLKKRRPLYKTEHSIVVATEILLARKNGLNSGKVTLHPETHVFLKIAIF